MNQGSTYDCLIVGAGPGGIQAAIYLARYRFRTLLLDRTGGRTRMAKLVENYLGYPKISGEDLLDIGLRQTRHFGVEIVHDNIRELGRDSVFKALSDKAEYRARFAIAATGVMDNIPVAGNIQQFFGHTVFTCIDCDGYKTIGKQLLVVGKDIAAVRLALAMHRMYTQDITLVLTTDFELPEDYLEALRERHIWFQRGKPVEFLGERDRVGGLELDDGTIIQCEAVMLSYGIRLNDGYLKGLDLDTDSHTGKYRVNHNFQSSLDGLYIVGPLNSGPSQIVISAGAGATAALDIKARLIEQEL